MKRRFTLLSVLFSLFLVTTPLRADFVLQPISGALIGDLPYARVAGPYMPGPSPFEKEPRYLDASVKYGSVTVAGKTIDYVLFGPTGSLEPDSVIFDLNGNKDLTDDEMLKAMDGDVAGSIEVPVEGLRYPVHYEVVLRPYGVFLYTKDWFEGTIDFQGAEREAVLIDADMDGLRLGGEDCLMIDLNGDGKFEADFVTYRIECLAPLRSVVLLAGKPWRLNLEVNEDARNIELQPFEGPVGTVNLRVALPEPEGAPVAPRVVDHSFVSRLIGPAELQYVCARSGDFPITLPTGAYAVPSAVVALHSPAREDTIIRFRTVEPITVSSGQETAITVGDKIADLEVQVRQEEQNIVVTHQPAQPEAIRYTSLQFASREGRLVAVAAPQVQIYTGESEVKPVATGRMTRPDSEVFQYTWEITKDLREDGGDVRVVVTRDLGPILGEVRAEQTITVQPVEEEKSGRRR